MEETLDQLELLDLLLFELLLPLDEEPEELELLDLDEDLEEALEAVEFADVEETLENLLTNGRPRAVGAGPAIHFFSAAVVVVGYRKSSRSLLYSHLV